MSEIGELGSHRYPTSWLEDRFEWLTSNGVPAVPDWTIIAQGYSKTQMPTADQTSNSGQEKEYQEFLLKKLGKIKLAQEEDRFTVDHEITVCGKVVKVPVMSMEVDDQVDLISGELLQVLQMTPAERRARAQAEDAVQKTKGKQASKIMNGGLGSRLKLALKPFSEQLVAQMDKELEKKTRSEVFRKIKFMVKVKGKRSKINAKKDLAKKLNIKKVGEKLKAHVKATVAKKIAEDSKNITEEVLEKDAKKVKADDAAEKVTKRTT